jgi:hypothetical protein
MPDVIADSAVSPQEIGFTPEDVAKRWHTEISLAKKARKKWMDRSRKIVQRYRDERSQDEETDGQRVSGVRFNVLWSNVQTLLPAIYAKAPRPVVERRFLDRDPVGRTASRILERCLSYTIEAGYFHEAVRKTVLDYLLPGQGVLWGRYEPTYTDGPPVTQTNGGSATPLGPSSPVGASPPSAAGTATAAVPSQIVASEMVCTDYVHWEDFLANPARTCDELRWKGKRAFLTRNELVARFRGKGLTDQELKEVPLNYAPKDWDKANDKSSLDEMFKKAEIWELWNKDDRKVYFISEHYNKPLEVADDPLQLECFWPSPDPLLATIANDSIVPTPDYVEYQDQALELDSLTARIAALTKAIKAAGVYDASVPALKRLLEEGTENTLYPIENWSQFASKNGMDGALDLLPIKEMAEVLIRLYEARAQVKADLQEITGMSDIVRGQATAGAPKTATEQRIKGQFANLRLSDRQSAVAVFARDFLRIVAEIISEHFSPMTLLLMSGYEQWGPEEFAGHHVPTPPPQQPGMPLGPPVSPPGQPPQMPGQPPMPMEPPPPDPQMLAMERFQAAIDLLKKDKLRGFRVDIETDSTIEPDVQAEKQARVEFLGAVAQFLPQALEAAAQQPKMAPLMGKMLLFGVRGFRVGRELETAMEETIADLEKMAANPPPKPPTPEEVKTQTEQAKARAELEKMRMQAQIDAETAQRERDQAEADFVLEQQKMVMERDKLQMQFDHEQRMLVLKEREAGIQMMVKERGIAIQADAQERQAELAAESADHKHALGLEMMDAKAAQAKARPKDGARP